MKGLEYWPFCCWCEEYNCRRLFISSGKFVVLWR